VRNRQSYEEGLKDEMPHGEVKEHQESRPVSEDVIWEMDLPALAARYYVNLINHEVESFPVSDL
jgi:hypothetical protein